MLLPRGELNRASYQDDHTDRDRNGMRQCRRLHRKRRQRDAQHIDDHSERGPNEEVPHADQRGQAAQAPTAGPGDSPPVMPQHEH